MRASGGRTGRTRATGTRAVRLRTVTPSAEDTGDVLMEGEKMNYNEKKTDEMREQARAITVKALELLSAELDSVDFAGATTRIDALCNVIRTMGGVR